MDLISFNGPSRLIVHFDDISRHFGSISSLSIGSAIELPDVNRGEIMKAYNERIILKSVSSRIGLFLASFKHLQTLKCYWELLLARNGPEYARFLAEVCNPVALPVKTLYVSEAFPLCTGSVCRIKRCRPLVSMPFVTQLHTSIGVIADIVYRNLKDFVPNVNTIQTARAIGVGNYYVYANFTQMVRFFPAIELFTSRVELDENTNLGLLATNDIPTCCKFTVYLLATENTASNRERLFKLPNVDKIILGMSGEIKKEELLELFKNLSPKVSKIIGSSFEMDFVHQSNTDDYRMNKAELAAEAQRLHSFRPPWLPSNTTNFATIPPGFSRLTSLDLMRCQAGERKHATVAVETKNGRLELRRLFVQATHLRKLKLLRVGVGHEFFQFLLNAPVLEEISIKYSFCLDENEASVLDILTKSCQWPGEIRLVSLRDSQTMGYNLVTPILQHLASTSKNRLIGEVDANYGVEADQFNNPEDASNVAVFDCISRRRAALLDLVKLSEGNINLITIFHNLGRGFAWFGNPKSIASLALELHRILQSQLKRPRCIILNPFDGPGFNIVTERILVSKDMQAMIRLNEKNKRTYSIRLYDARHVCTNSCKEKHSKIDKISLDKIDREKAKEQKNVIKTD